MGVTIIPGVPIFRNTAFVKTQKPITSQPTLPQQSVSNSASKNFFPPPSLRFGGLIDNDHSVELRCSEYLNAPTVSAVQRGLLLWDMIKKSKGDESSLKLFLSGSPPNLFPSTDRTALADTLALVNRPVDVIVKSFIDCDTVKTLLSATGKRFMMPGGSLYLGPVKAGAPFQRNDDHAIERKLQNNYIREFEYLLMSRAGVPDRATAFHDLTSGRHYSPLEALSYGSKGLIEGILVGYDRVVTRQNLETYFKKNNFNQKRQSAFVKEFMNVYKLPSQKLEDFSPESIPTKLLRPGFPEVSWYRSPKEQAETKKEKLQSRRSRRKSIPKDLLQLYVNDEEVVLKELPLNLKVNAEKIKPTRLFIENLKDTRSILEDDVIYFNDDFNDETAEQISEALKALDNKKNSRRFSSNIKILINTPGGFTISGVDIRNAIHSLKTPVDVIVMGMAASCGAFLLGSATGNRFITPNGRIMLHDAWNEFPQMPVNLYNQDVDALHEVTQDFVSVLSHASGRPFKSLYNDMKVDVWLNPLEALFYGKKGMVDGILVGQDKVITREDVNAYLCKRLGGQRAVDRYIQQRIRSLREGKQEWRPEKHNESDPFDNLLKTIHTVASQKAKPIQSVKKLARSVSKEKTSVDYFVVAPSVEEEEEEA